MLLGGKSLLRFFNRNASTAAEERRAATDIESKSRALLDKVQGALANIGEKASVLGHDAAKTRGIIEDADGYTSAQVSSIKNLVPTVLTVNRSQLSIADLTKTALSAVAEARDVAVEVQRGVQGIDKALAEVGESAKAIRQISLQTRILSINAAVVANRAGDSGKSFGVIAAAIKDLAMSTDESTTAITKTLEGLSRELASLREKTRPSSITQPAGALEGSLTNLSEKMDSISSASKKSQDECQQLGRDIEAAAHSVSGIGSFLRDATKESESFLRVAEELMDSVVGCDIPTADTSFIRWAQETAQRFSSLLEEALADGRISSDSLFDESYAQISGVEPPQYLTKFTKFADDNFPAIQEPILSNSAKIVYCVAVDRNGYVPTHNRSYCNPPGSDPAWNAMHSRWRRILNDRTGLSSARNTRPFLLQTYRRDLGGGRKVLLKEAAAPITVHGRHWGAVRIAYHF